MQVRVGTSGYQYKFWKGTFYDAKCKESDMLAAYASSLGTVEINNTFYRMPKPEVLAKWAAAVPDTFRFAIKAPQRITHMQRLKVEDDSLAYFVKALDALGGKLGVVLFQLPPFLRKDVTRLRTFLSHVPKSLVTSFEFRHESWHDDEVFSVLREHRAALCTADTDDADGEIVVTGATGYVRLRREHYDDATLAVWAERIRTQPFEQAFVYFKHEPEAPFFAQRLEAALARPGLAKAQPEAKRRQRAG